MKVRHLATMADKFLWLRDNVDKWDGLPMPQVFDLMINAGLYSAKTNIHDIKRPLYRLYEMVRLILPKKSVAS